VSLERAPLNLVSTIEELLGLKSSGSGLQSREYGLWDPLRWPRDTIYPQKLTLTSPTSSGRSIGPRAQCLFLSSKLLGELLLRVTLYAICTRYAMQAPIERAVIIHQWHTLLNSTLMALLLLLIKSMLDAWCVIVSCKNDVFVWRHIFFRQLQFRLIPHPERRDISRSDTGNTATWLRSQAPDITDTICICVKFCSPAALDNLLPGWQNCTRISGAGGGGAYS
jgi:hypothetical protein